VCEFVCDDQQSSSQMSWQVGVVVWETRGCMDLQATALSCESASMSLQARANQADIRTRGVLACM